MDVRIIHFYPDLMNLYGSYANITLLRRHLEDLSCKVQVDRIVPGQDADISHADFLFMGAGTERSQLAALRDFRRFAPAVRSAAEAGTVMLFAGTAMELLGKTITTADGTVHEGIGLADFTSVQSNQRIAEDVLGFTDLFEAPVVGFMNKCSRISGVTTPLLTRCTLGFGNESSGGPEGYHSGNVFASELTGPLLVKNPLLLGAVIHALYQHREQPLPVEIPTYPVEEQAYAVTAQQLGLRASKP